MLLAVAGLAGAGPAQAGLLGYLETGRVYGTPATWHASFGAVSVPWAVGVPGNGYLVPVGSLAPKCWLTPPGGAPQARTCGVASVPGGGWVVYCASDAESPQLPNGEWHARFEVITLTSIGRVVTETVEDDFWVENIWLTGPLTTVSATPLTLDVRVSDPFVSLAKRLTFGSSGVVGWSAHVGDGTELPAACEATGTFWLQPLGAGSTLIDDGHDTPECTYGGTIDLEAPWPPQLHYREFTVFEGGDASADHTSSMATDTECAEVALTGFTFTGPRQGEVSADLTMPAAAANPPEEANHVWMDPDGELQSVEPDVEGAWLRPQPVTLPSRAFGLAGDYCLAAAYKDDGHAHYHEGANKWLRPGADSFHVPGCALMSGGDWAPGTPDIVLPPKPEYNARVADAWAELGDVLGPGGAHTFYSGGAPLHGVIEDVTKEQFLAACADPLNAVVEFAGHGGVGGLQFNTADDSALVPMYASELPTRDPKAKLVVLSTCHGLEGGTDGVGATCCTQMAEAVVGYNGEIGSATATYMDQRLWYYLTKCQHTVGQAVYYADIDGQAQYPPTEYAPNALQCLPAGSPTKLGPAFAIPSN